jgi:hypothetical protein
MPVDTLSNFELEMRMNALLTGDVPFLQRRKLR